MHRYDSFHKACTYVSKYSLVLLIAFFLSDSLASELRFSHLGLQQASVDVLAQDSYGFLWIGTKDGLIRYDGSVIKTYQNIPDDPTTLQSNTIIALHYTKKERLWVGTPSNGASYYDYSKNKFTRIDTHVIGKNAYRFFNDDKGKGIFVQTEKGLFFIDQKDEAKLVLSSKYSESVLGLYSDPTGIHAILETGKKLTLGSAPHTPLEAPLFPATIAQYWPLNFCQHLIRKPIKAGGGSGLFYCLQEDKITPSGLNEVLGHAEIDLAQLLVHDLIEDNAGTVWISSNLGLIQVVGELVTVISSAGFDGKSLSSNNLSILLSGKKHTLFIGTQDQGLNILSLEKSGISHFDTLLPVLLKDHKTSPPNEKLPCSSANKTDRPPIWSTLKDSEGDWWIGNNTGLAYRQKGSGNFQDYSQLGNTDQFIDGCSVGALAEADGKIWIGTSAGLFTYNKDKKAAKKYEFGGNDNDDTLSGRFIRALLHDDKRRILWVGTDQKGLYRIDLSSLKVQHFPIATSGASTLPNDQILSLFLDRDNRLWVGTGSGFSLWDEGSNTFKTITASDDPATLSDAAVYVITQPDQGNLWLGTGNGLNRFNIDQFKVEKRFYERDGLVNSTIYGLAPDNQGSYWITTANGLSLFNPTKERFSNYYPQHDAQSDVFNHDIGHSDKKGLIYIAGLDGLSVINPQAFVNGEQSYPPVLTHLDGLDNQGSDTDMAQMLSPSNNLTVKAIARDVRINFTHPFFGDSDLLKSQYRLLPATETWSETYPGSHFVDYTNLKPGIYNFQLRVNLADRVTSSFRFSIEPYFWETVWFKSLALAIILILTVFTSIYGYRAWSKFSAEKLTRQHYRIVEHELRPHLHEANKHLQDLLQSPRLTLKDKQHIRYSIVPLVTKSIDFIAELRTLVDLRRTVRQPKQLYMLEDVLDEAMLFFKDNQHRIIIGEVEDINILTHQDAVYLLVKNLISNGIKYSPEGQVVFLNVYRQQRSLFIECIDQGIGISKDKRKAIYEPYKRFTGEYKHINGQGIGLAIVRFIVHTYRGSIHIEDNQPKGSRFKVELKGVVADEQ